MFWENPKKCVKEILRVLKPSGIAYFGGGIGRNLQEEEYEFIKNEIYKPLQEEEEEEKFKTGTPFIMLKSIYTKEFLTKWITIFEELNISVYTVIKNAGIFFKIEKISTPVDKEIY
jgi:ubiquinone/menaquinone biosynthesis C-methylase UbiE